jgi:cytochrome c553
MKRALIASTALLLAACGAPARPADPELGRALFGAPVESERGPQQACVRCHALGKDERSATGLGTNFYDIGLRAEREVPGQNAEQYLRTSIVDPDAHLSGGFQDGLMYRGYKTALSEEQISDLVAYMLTLRGGP